MPWFKVDDGWWSHPKTLMLSDAAQALWLRAGSWSMKHLTDGVIPKSALVLLRAEPKTAAELVRSGMWLRDPAGFRFHDWGVYQPPKSKVLEDRAAAAERMREVRANKPRTSENVRQPSVRSPRPGPARTSKEVGEPPRRCAKHIDDEDPPNCLKCRDARLKWEAWDEERKQPKSPGKTCKHRYVQGWCANCSERDPSA